MREAVEYILGCLHTEMEVYAAYDGIPIFRKGQQNCPYAILVPDKLEWGKPFADIRPFTLWVRILVMLPMNSNGAQADRFFEEDLQPGVLSAGGKLLLSEAPKADERINRLVCSRSYRLDAAIVTSEESQ